MPFPLLSVRAAIFVTTNTFASITLGLAIYLLYLGPFRPSDTLPAVVAAFSHLVSVTTMALISRTRDGAFTSMVSFEVGWLSFLCAMWLAACVVVAIVPRIFICQNALCGAIQAIGAFSFLNSIILLGYIITLVVAAVKAGRAGRNIWLSDVKEIQQARGPASHEKGNANPTVMIYPPVNNPHYNVPPAMPQFQPYQQQHGWSQAQPHPPPPLYPSVPQAPVV